MTSRRSAAVPFALAAAALAGLLITALVAGCTLLFPQSPTSTITDANGQQVTLNWADYPASSYVPAADVLAAPRAEEVEAVGDEVLLAVQAAVDASMPGLDWQSGADGGIYERSGNGYGGPSLHRVLNSPELSAVEVPADWDALADAIDVALAEQGYGPVEWDFDREAFPHETQDERDADVRSTNGSLDPAAMWQWMGTANNGSMWVSVALWDVDRGVGAPVDVPRDDPRMLAIMVGGTVIAAADEQAYRDGIAPFAGLELPEETHSD